MHAFWQDNYEITLSRQPKDILALVCYWNHRQLLLRLVSLHLRVYFMSLCKHQQSSWPYMIVSVTDELRRGTVGSSSVGTVDCSIGN